MINSTIRPLLIGGLVFTTLSCSEAPQTGSDVTGDNVQEQALVADSIQWFDGSVDDAFALAKLEDKPVYLYWGAEWCPPCHAIKATVFRSAEFIARSKLFVAVYLDGDDENAQAFGEKFGVLGYPTMVVFDSGGDELTRIPGGIDIQAYAIILDLTLGNLAPVGDLVNSIVIEGESITGKECQLLAYYSWQQSPALLEQFDEAALYRSVYEACPAESGVERSIVYMNYLETLMAAGDEESGEAFLDAEQIEEAKEMVDTILSDPAAIRANLFSIMFEGAHIIKALTDSDSDSRNAMLARFNTVMNKLVADENLYKLHRLYALLGKLRLEKIDDSERELSAELQSEIRSTIAWADESTPDPYERQTIINTASGILESAGMEDAAESMLLAELEKSKQPYYFMLSLADIEQAAGNYDQAVDWLRKAYDASTGPATRFQWGYYYVAGLLEMRPDDTDLIRVSTVEVIRELEAGSGIYQRPKGQLERLEGRLLDWSETTDQLDVIKEIRTDVLAVCDSFAGERDSFDTCQAFLDSA